MRIGSVSYATEQGLSYLMKSFFDAGVITDPLIFRYPGGRRTTHLEWYPPGTPVVSKRPFLSGSQTHTVREWLDRIDVLLCFETPLDWSIIPACRERSVKTVLTVMYEWHPERPPYVFDRIISPSLLDQQCFPGSEFVPVPVDPSTWKQRTHARRFLHNAGHVGCRNHKGTDTLLQALCNVRTRLDITIRCQDAALLDNLRKLSANPPSDNCHVTYETGSIPYERLFSEHDVYVAPERFNGLSLPLQEARAAGMLVMTTDRFPANAWLPQEPLIPVQGYQKARTQATNLEFDEAIVDPVEVARVIDLWNGHDISEYSLSGKEWAEANSWDVLKPRWLAALEG